MDGKGYPQIKDRFYLPSQSEGVRAEEYLTRYVEREFPENRNGECAVYSVPRNFQKSGESQAVSAEYRVFSSLHGLKGEQRLRNTWVTFFHSASYAGHSHRNNRSGKLMIREHDFVVFVKKAGKYFVSLVEVKSSHDENANVKNLEYTSNAQVIKNNKRSAQHQLRDHLEVILKLLNLPQSESHIQTYIMWPFLGSVTRDPKHNVIKRWRDEPTLHVFEDTLSKQENFSRWFVSNVVSSPAVKEEYFFSLLKRFIILSCGVFVDEINAGMMALLNQEQLDILKSAACNASQGAPLVVHGAAGTGKTLLILKKLEQLYQKGQLNDQNRALYICYWPGIRCEVEQKLKQLNLSKYVDTSRFYISQSGFLNRNKAVYKHIFMDESEAICLSFDTSIMKTTMSEIFRRYRQGNCYKTNCNHEENNVCATSTTWGELWFLVDMHQASLLLPRATPQILRKPAVILSKVIRSTGNIYSVFRQFYSNPMPSLPQQILSKINIPQISLGHNVCGPPVFWVDIGDVNDETNVSKSLDILCNVTARVIIDLCGTKGFRANDICIIPFFLNERCRLDAINETIRSYFVENGFRPNAVGEIENFLVEKGNNDFLVSWALKLKGIEFKVVVLVIDEDDYDPNDSEDRKKTYIMVSRCTSLLIVVSASGVKEKIDLNKEFVPYSFNLKL